MPIFKVSGAKLKNLNSRRNKNDIVIDQSLSYLKWLKSRKPGYFENLT